MSARAAALQVAARTAAEDLLRHKQGQRYHRQAAREAAARLDHLQAECARLGIALELIPERVPGRTG